MKKCPFCGYENSYDDLYCPNCGRKPYRCSNCGEEVIGDVKACPKCGNKIENFAKECAPRGMNVNKINRIGRVFNRIASIISIVVFSLSLVFCFGNYLSYSEYSSLSSKGSAFYYLVDVYLEFAKSLNGSIDAIKLTSAIISSLIVITNIVIVIIFSIKGLISSIKGLKNGDGVHNQKHLITVFLSYALSVKLLLLFSPTLTDGIPSIEGVMKTVITLQIIDMIFEVFIATFTSYRRHQVNKLIEKAIYGSLLIAVILIILFINVSALRIESESYSFQGLLFFFIKGLFIDTSNAYITCFVISATLVSFQLLEIASLVIISLFFASCFYDHNNAFRLKITTYVLALFTLIIAFAETLISIVLFIILSIYNPSLSISIEAYPFNNLCLCFVLFALSVASFVLAKSSRKEELKKAHQ